MIALAIGQPWQHELLGDAEFADLVDWSAQLAHLRAVELAWLQACVDAGQLDATTAARAIEVVRTAPMDRAALGSAAARDGVVVPEFVRRLRQAAVADARGEAVRDAIHTGLTSQDVIDAAALLSAQQIDALLRARIERVLAHLDALLLRHGERAMASRTRMQLAGRMRVRDRLHAWRAPLQRALARLDELEQRLLSYAPGGADGLAAGALQDPALGEAMAKRLGLSAGEPRHAQRDLWVEYGQWLAGVCGQVGKIGGDACLMAQQGIDEMALRDGGGSSAMPHKRNPVAAETMVAVARFAASLAGALHSASLHEQERSGAAWTLEWMALSQLQASAAVALRHTAGLLCSIDRMGP